MLSALTPIALMGYRNELQHEQHKLVSANEIYKSVQTKVHSDSSFAHIRPYSFGIGFRGCICMGIEKDYSELSRSNNG